MILSQTKIFNNFPGSIQASSIAKVLSSFYNRYRYNYAPTRDLWINRLYFDMSNLSKKQCLKINTKDVNDLGPAKFRTQADNNKEQICYYNQNKRDKRFNCFLAVRKQTSTTNQIVFSIVNLIDKTHRNNNIHFEINNKLSYFNNDNVQYKHPIQRISESDTVGKTSTDGNSKRQHTTRNDRWVSKKPQFLLG